MAEREEGSTLQDHSAQSGAGVGVLAFAQLWRLIWQSGFSQSRHA